ncbi:MAG: hypothetical protein HUU56_10040 [Bdellovibrionaceae bacterium]|nr:hypothetical protein [Pseudobdellovibrionaceae bacterium]
MKFFTILLLLFNSGCYLNASITDSKDSNSKTIVENPADSSQPSAPIEKTCTDSFLPVNNLAASIVIGQVDFINNLANQGGAAGANTISGPDGVSILSNGQVYVGEFFNHRYLIFDKVPEVNNASADRVFGQPDFYTTTANTGGVSGLSLWTGRNVVWNGTQFFMADMINNRVLVWNSLPANTSVNPDYVLGQSSFNTNTNALGNSSLDSGYGAISVADNKLFVADTWSNHRVLIFDLPITASFQAASNVIGQPDFNSNMQRSTADGFDEPAHAISFNGKLIVADRYNNRVLIFNSIPTTPNAPADVVIGQVDKVSSLANQGGSVNRNTLFGPHSVAVDYAGRLYIADTENHRVLVFNSIPTTDNSMADYVIGQPNFTTNSANSGSTPTDKSLNRPTFVTYGFCHLAIADQMNNRVLLFK